MLVLLGAWGAIAPFIGPSFNFAFTPDKSWQWTAGRGWYEVLPGVVAFVGGLLLLFAAKRSVTLLGAWLGVLAGAWFIVGPPLSTQISLGSIGHPQGSNSGLRIAEELAFFSGLGALILFFAAAAFGRLSVVTLRDVRSAERREAERREAEAAIAAREAARRDERDDYPDDRYQGNEDGRSRTGDEPYDREQYDREQYDRGAEGSRAPAPPPPGPGTGYHSALGYRQGEPTTQYTPPSYGHHAASPEPPAPPPGSASGPGLGTGSGTEQGVPPSADAPPGERPR